MSRAAKRKKRKLKKVAIVLFVLAAFVIAYFGITKGNKEKPDISKPKEIMVVVPDGYEVEPKNQKVVLTLTSDDYVFPVAETLKNTEENLPSFKLYKLENITDDDEFVVKKADESLDTIKLYKDVFFAESFKCDWETEAIREEAAKIICEDYKKVSSIKLSNPIYLNDRYIMCTAEFCSDEKNKGLVLLMYLNDEGYWERKSVVENFAYDELVKTAQRNYINPYLLIDGNYPYCIKLNRATNVISIYTLDENDKYTVLVKTMICSCSIQGNETPVGEFAMESYKSLWHKMPDGSWAEYAFQFLNGGYLFHSVCYDNPSNNSVIAKMYNSLGSNTNLGSIVLQTKDARWIYDNIMVKTKLIIYDDASVKDTLPKPEKVILSINKENDCGWDPSNPLPENPWRYK